MRGFIVFVLVLLCLGAVYGVYHDRMANGHYAGINKGSTEQQVLNSMGTPAETNPTCSAYGTTVIGDCDHVLVYRSAFSFVTKKYWSFFIDRRGNVVDKAMQAKP